MRQRGLVIVLLAALALVATACSGDDESPPAAATGETSPGATSTESAPPASTGAVEQPPDTSTAPPGGPTADPALIADAAGRTVAAESAKIATTVRVVRPGVGQDRFRGVGAFDFAGGKGEMTLELVEGEGAPGAKTKAVFADSAVYYQLPPGTLGGGARWVRLDLENIGATSGVDLGPIVQGSQADPSQYLLWLRALGPGVTKIGEEDVRGVPTSRYRAAVDLNQLEHQAPPGKEAEWAAYVQTLRDRIGLEFIPVEVWVDDDGLIRRLYHEYGFAADGLRSTVTTELFDFGVDVNAQAPPPAQVTAIDDLIRP